MIDTGNKEKNWELFLNRSRFPLDYVKLYVKGLKQSSKADEYVVQNLVWSGAYLRSTLSYALLQKVLKLVPLIETGLEVYVATVNTVLSYYYTSLGNNI